MALTQFSGSLTWLQLWGLAYEAPCNVVAQRVRVACRYDLVYQPSHMADWRVASAEAVAHVIPYSRGEFACRGYAEGPSSFFRWAGLDANGKCEIRTQKMSGGLWAIEYEGPADIRWHRLVRDACSEPTELAETAAVRPAAD